MARVVQRRSNPPVLVILFVFLFVISAALAALFYSNLSDQKKLTDEAKKARNALLRSDEQNEQVASLKEDARKQRKSVVGLLIEQQNHLIEQIGGAPAEPYEAAKQAVAKTLTDLGGETGLLNLIDELNDKLRGADKQIAQLQGQVQSLNDTVMAKQKGLDKAAAEFAESEEAFAANLAAARQANDALATKFKLELDEARKRWETDLAVKETRLGEKDDALSARDDQILALKGDTEKLNEAIKELRRPIPETVKADGSVLRADLNEGVVYIDVGLQDGVRPGMPFSIFPAGDWINVKKAKPKGTLVVRNADEGISECRITASGRMAPIVEGDAILNIARGLGREPTFVVAGEFDLDGDGAPDARGRERLAAMIGDYGGRIVDTVSYTVDYVVIGSVPTLPPAPDSETNPGSAALYDRKRQELQGYQDIQQAATKHLVPVLNANRFWSLIGYARGPER